MPSFVPPIPSDFISPDYAQLATALATGAAARAAGDGAAALDAYRAAIACAPLAHEPYQLLADLLEAQGAGVDALACRMAALALESGTALDLYNLATAYLMGGHHAPAEAWYRLTLLVDPELVLAHRNLAALLRDTGRPAAARVHQDAAYRRQHCFDNGVDAPPVLLICAAGRGNVPLDFWFPPHRTRRIEYMIDYAPPESDAAILATLPASAIRFNAIGDADVAQPLLERLSTFAAQAGAGLLNPPGAVARTARDSLPDWLAQIDGAIVPPVLRIDQSQGAADVARLRAGEPSARWLLRPVQSHGGEGLVLVEAGADLPLYDWSAASQFYLTRFHDFRSADGYYRKYRMIYLAGRPYPYHLAISNHWLVHYFSADMLAHPWKQAEEARFLTDPTATLGDGAMRTLAAIGQRLGLDYAGIDFSVLPDGRVLVFEANATMLVHAEADSSPLAYKNAAVATLRRAFSAMLVEAAQR